VILYDDIRLFRAEFPHGKTKRMPVNDESGDGDKLDQKLDLFKRRFNHWSSSYLAPPDGCQGSLREDDSVDSFPVNRSSTKPNDPTALSQESNADDNGCLDMPNLLSRASRDLDAAIEEELRRRHTTD